VLKTYTFYFHDDGDDAARFEPVLCASDPEASGRARSMLLARPGCREIEVYFGDVRLFGVTRNPPSLGAGA
jgi:hypothetical protein